MIKKNILAGLLGLIIVIGFSCQNRTSKNELDILPPGNHRAEVIEVEQTPSYTYLQVEEGEEKYWMAVARAEYTKGESIYFLQGMEMEGFFSKELDRTFEKIYFVSAVSDEPIYSNQQTVKGKTKSEKPKLSKLDIEIEIPSDGISIGDLYSNMEEYKDKMVLVRGQVAKVNLSIMDRNWIHLQDGSGDEKDFDLTVTTLHQPKVGDVVTYRGRVGVNKDFGMGYSYKLILEEAEVVE